MSRPPRGRRRGIVDQRRPDCTAATRAYIQRPIYDAFVNRVAELMGEVRIGAVDDPKTDMGSLISKAHREKVAGMVERAREAGARIVCGGRIPEGSPEDGAYYEPTLIADAAQDSEIVQDEVFGPVLVACRSTPTTRPSNWPTTLPTDWRPRRGRRTCPRPARHP